MPTFSFKPPYLYKKQRELVFGEERFSIVEASTKSGKTVSMIVWIFWQAIQGKAGQNCWWVAPVFNQTKIAFRRLKRFINNNTIYKANESELSIKLFNGVTIWFKSGDNPDNLYGEDVIACVIDEGSRCKMEVWHAVRSTLTATKGKCKIIGNVKGTNNWTYDLGQKVRNNELSNWKYYKLTAHDAIEGGVFDKEELEEARRTLPDEVFQELYMAEAFDDKGKPFVWAFDEKLHVIDSYTFDKVLPIYISFDFNVDPITCIVAQHRMDKSEIIVFDEFKLANSNIYQLCERIKAKYPLSLPIVINADATGKNRTAISNLNYLQVIQKELMISNYNMKVGNVNPSVNNSRLLTNALFSRHPYCKVTKNCENLIKDLKYVQTNDSGEIVKDRSKEYRKADLLDCLRYYYWANFTDFLNKNYYQ